MIIHKKDTKGITLIALIITIIVMLILAGVTISLTLGENGIFTTAEKAAKNYTNAQEKELAEIEFFTSAINKAVTSIENNYIIAGTIIKTENNINYTVDGAGNIIPVPVGFSPIITSDQGTRTTGFVIKNDTDGNEFVWVPVEGMNYKYDRYIFLSRNVNVGIDEETKSIMVKPSEDSEYYYTEALSEDERISVEKYGGYYIGRYETGIKEGVLSSTSSSSITDTSVRQNWTGWTSGELTIQANQQVWNYVTRDKAISVARELYSKEKDNVFSKLCSGYAWDTTLKFMESTGSTYPTNSSGGNHNTATGGTGKVQKTGWDKSHPCNIYDMGGNVFEWTTEIYSEFNERYTARGGNIVTASNHGSAATYDKAWPFGATEGIGFRIALFM